MLKGVLIKECLSNEDIIDLINIEKVEIWKTDDKPKYWTAIHFSTQDLNFPKKLCNGILKNWYCDMKYKDRIKVIVFRKKVLQYTIGNEKEKLEVLRQCKKIGVPKNALNWTE